MLSLVKTHKKAASPQLLYVAVLNDTVAMEGKSLPCGKSFVQAAKAGQSPEFIDCGFSPEQAENLARNLCTEQKARNLIIVQDHPFVALDIGNVKQIAQDRKSALIFFPDQKYCLGLYYPDESKAATACARIREKIQTIKAGITKPVSPATARTRNGNIITPDAFRIR